MSKFTNAAPRGAKPVTATSPLKTTTQRIPTYEGGDGFAKSAEMELFQLAVTNMVGEDTFYESGASRDGRFERLIHQVTQSNPDFFLEKADGREGFISFLRNTMNMRSASLVAAAEYAAVGGPNARQVIANALVRGDEPGEFLGYWLSKHGRSMGGARMRGLADATTKLYNEFNLLKYDGQSKDIRFGDVIEFVHPKPKGQWQADLFKHAIDRRHNRGEQVPESLEKVALDRYLMAMPESKRRAAIKTDIIEQAGWNWERLSGWIPGGMDAEAWETVIPNMGYMALLRNLRNFEQAKISDNFIDAINTDLSNPEQVAKSRQFPYRFWSAYKANPSVTFVRSLEKALELSTQNIPELSGRTLILIDTSGSMQSTVSAKSQVQCFEVGALFAAALAKKSQNADVVVYASTSAEFNLLPNESVLRFIERMRKNIGRVGMGTATWASIAKHYNGHDRVVVFTDGQTADSENAYGAGRYGQTTFSRNGLGIPMLHTFDLGGYRASMTESGKAGRFSYGGFSDATFTLMGLLEAGESADWPF